MEVSGEAADVVVRESMAIATEGAKLAGAAVKNVAAFLLALANAKPQEEKVIIGRVTAKALAKDPAPAVVTPLNKEDLQRFRKLALPRRHAAVKAGGFAAASRRSAGLDRSPPPGWAANTGRNPQRALEAPSPRVERFFPWGKSVPSWDKFLKKER